MEQKTGQKGQRILPALTLFWLGQPICFALISLNCSQIQWPLKSYVKVFDPFCSPPKGSGLVVFCHQVTNLPEVLLGIPKEVGALCLTGKIKELKEQAFQAFPELHYLRLHIFHPELVISPTAFLGLRKLEHLILQNTHRLCSDITIPVEVLLPITSLQTLTLAYFRLTGQKGIKFPMQLNSLSMLGCCLKQISELFNIFPLLNLMSQVSLDDCIMKSSPSSLNVSALAVPVSQFQKEKATLHAQKTSPLQSLILRYSPLDLSDLLGLGVGKLDSLTMVKTKNLRERNETYRICALASRFSLRSLTFSQNEYKSFDSQELPDCYSVENLVLQKNKMEQVDSLLLYKLPHLQLLDLSGNHLPWELCPLEYEKMNFTSKLRFLDFSDNRFSPLQSDSFSCLPGLETLSLNNCELEKIPVSAFSGLGQLNILNLKYNNISNIEHLFLNLSRLTSLDLTGNPMGMLRTDFFQGVSLLRELHFGSQNSDLDIDLSITGLNLLDIISKSRIQFYGKDNIFPTLKKLTLRCKELVVNLCNFPVFPHVTELHLSNLANFISFCNASKPFFHQFPLLEELVYIISPVSSYWKGLNFSSLPSLRILQVYNLAIVLKDISTSDAQYLFQNLTQLEVLYLQNSGLKYVSTVLFQGMKSLKLLMMFGETILQLDSGFQDELKQLRYLYLYHVSFGCYCSNAWFASWASGKEDLYVYIRTQLTCQQVTRVKKMVTFLKFVEQNCSLKIDFILFLLTSFLLLLLLLFPLVHATCGPELFFLIYMLRGWWHQLCGKRGQGKRFAYDAFVSYCMQDQKWVLQYLVPHLEQKGPPFLKLCLHSRDFVAGKAVVDNIMDNLYRSRKAICVVSRQSLGNPWCSLEMSLATYRHLNERKDTLILVFLEHISKYQLSAYHRLAKLVKRKTYLDWPEAPTAQAAFWDRLRNSLRYTDGEEEERI